jgi:MFS family permease
MGLYLSGTGVVARLRIAELAEPSERGRAFGLLGSTFGLSMVAGSFVDSAIANDLNYVAYFYFAAILATIPFVPFLFFRVGSTRKIPHGAPPVGQSGLHSPLRTNELILLGLVAVSIFSSWGFFTSLMPVIVTKAPIRATSSEAVITFGLFSASSMIFQPLMGEYGSRRPRLWITLGLGLNGAVLLLLTVASGILLVYLLTFIAGACYATVSPVSLSQLMTKVPGNYLGRVLGFYGGAEDVGIIIGPFVGSVVWQFASLTLAFVSMGLILIGVLFVYLAAIRPARAKTHQPQILINE